MISFNKSDYHKYKKFTLLRIRNLNVNGVILVNYYLDSVLKQKFDFIGQLNYVEESICFSVNYAHIYFIL